MRNNKKSNPVRVMLVWTLIFGVLAFAAWFGADFIGDMRAARLKVMTNEVTEYNNAQDQAYAVAMSEFEKSQAKGESPAWPQPAAEGWDVVDLTAYPFEGNSTATVLRNEAMNNGLLLVNEWHSRPADFDESTIVSVGNYTGWDIQVKDASVRLFPVAIDALQRAIADAKALGFVDYMVQGGYRTWDEQNTMFQNQVQRLQDRYSGNELINQAKKSVSYPGTSDYNSGLSFQLKLYNREDASIGRQNYTETAAGQWMSENCWKYGFVFRFPQEDYPLPGTLSKASKTGISLELDSYRYVGEGNAAVMHILDLCLEEYIEYLGEHPHIAVYENGVLKYEIVRQYVGEAASFPVSVKTTAASYYTSLDNMGYAVTVFIY